MMLFFESLNVFFSWRGIHAPGGTNQFEGGTIELYTAADVLIGQYNVEGNTTGVNSTVTLTVNVPANASKFKNLEDDDIGHNIDMTIDTSLWAERYEPACVKVNTTKTDLCGDNENSVNQNNVAFETNIGTVADDDNEKDTIKAKVSANKQSRSEPYFWVIYQLGGFQSRVDEDCDPNGDCTAGVSSLFSEPANDTEAGCIVYREVIRDAVANIPEVTISENNCVQAISLHESGHEFGLDDSEDDGKIMYAPTIVAANTQEKVDKLTFKGRGLKKIIIKSSPGVQ